MAHQILGQRFLGRSRPAWHGLGQVFDEDTSILASEAVKRVAGDIVVRPLPIFYKKEDGGTEEIKNYQAIVRSPTQDDPNEKIFGVTTERWNGVDYSEIAKSMDELSRTYKVETAGLIQEGALCFLSLRGPDFDVRGDQMQDYFIANLSNQPGNSHKILAAPVRVVCFNTNTAANNSASISFAIPHSIDAGAKIQVAATLVSQFKEMTKKMRETFERFASIQIGTSEITRIAKATFPLPTLPAELELFNRALNSQEQGALQEAMGSSFNRIVKAQEAFESGCKRSKQLQGTILERFEAFEPTNLRSTLWAGYNAATEVADWREGRGAEIASVWGTRGQEKARAFSESMALANLN